MGIHMSKQNFVLQIHKIYYSLLVPQLCCFKKLILSVENYNDCWIQFHKFLVCNSGHSLGKNGILKVGIGMSYWTTMKQNLKTQIFWVSHARSILTSEETSIPSWKLCDNLICNRLLGRRWSSSLKPPLLLLPSDPIDKGKYQCTPEALGARYNPGENNIEQKNFKVLLI